MGRLDGRVALVTGGGRGIGAEVCRAYAQEGAHVAVNFRPGGFSEASALALVAELAESPGDVIAVGADVSDEKQVEDMVDQVTSRLGEVDVLVANAANTHAGRKPWTTISSHEWDQMMAVNLRGVFLCAKAVHSSMAARGYGKIILVGSIMSMLGGTGSLHYVTSKAGLIGLTRSLSRETGGEGVRVNCIAPGAIRTEADIEVFSDQDAVDETLMGVQALKYRGGPSDVTGPFVFLAGHESDFVTGQVITVDGGWINY